jgi:hypothetical protein
MDVVKKYPIPAVIAATALGFWIGRNRGKAIAAAAAGLATNLVMRELNRVFDSSEF